MSCGIGPGAVDHEGVRLPRLQDRPLFFTRPEPALDPPGIERHRQAPVVRIPELLPGKKDAAQRLAVRVEHVNALPGFAAAHRRGKVDIDAKLIAWKHVCRRVDALDVRRGRDGARRSVECLFNRSSGAA